MSEDEAVAIVKDAIEELRASENEPIVFKTAGEMLGPNFFKKACDEANPRVVPMFKSHVKEWLLACSALGSGRIGFGWAHSWVMKPWLKAIVGWEAAGEIGRAADREGYMLLLEEADRRFTEAEQKRRARQKEE